MQPSGSTNSDPSTLRHEHSSTHNCNSFGLPFQQQTDLSVYQSTELYQSQYCSAPSVSPVTSTSDDRSDLSKENKMSLKEEVFCLIETYARMKNDFKNPKVRNKDIWCDISQEMLAEGHVSCDAKSWEPSSRTSKDLILHALNTTRKLEMMQINVPTIKNYTTYSIMMPIQCHQLCTVVGRVC